MFFGEHGVQSINMPVNKYGNKSSAYLLAHGLVELVLEETAVDLPIACDDRSAQPLSVAATRVEQPPILAPVVGLQLRHADNLQLAPRAQLVLLVSQACDGLACLRGWVA